MRSKIPTIAFCFYQIRKKRNITKEIKRMTNSIMHTMNDRCLKKGQYRVWYNIDSHSRQWLVFATIENRCKHSMNPPTAIKISLKTNLICWSDYSPNKTTLAINSSISQGMVSSAAGMRKRSICHNRLDPISSRNTRSPNPFLRSISLSIFPSRIPSSCQNVLNLYAKWTQTTIPPTPPTALPTTNASPSWTDKLRLPF